MSLRGRLAAAGAGAVFVALAIASLVIYFSVRSNLQGQIDVSLIQSAGKFAAKWNAANGQPVNVPAGTNAAAGKLLNSTNPPANGPVLGSDASGYFQVIPSYGTVTQGQPSVAVRLKTPLKGAPTGSFP